MGCNDYVSVSKRHGAPVLSGASMTFALPAIHDGDPRYVQGLHGFTAPRDGTAPTFDMPSTLYLFDAHTGAFLGERTLEPEEITFPVEQIDEEALARLGLAQDALKEYFFDGASTVPKDVEHVAVSYRKDFRLAVQRGHMSFYESHAHDWMAWVGLAP